jgi:pimeloyl-ACP methyl ester carboxylesterase
MKKVLLTILFSSVVYGLQSTDNYIWLHGLEGDRGSNTWDIYSAMFTPAVGHVLSYSSNNSINAIANNLYKKHIQSIEAGGSVVVIGHSMGGLVARALLNYTNRINGIVTVGTPHNGSTLLSNTLDGKVYNFFEHAITMSNNAIETSLWSGLFAGFPVTTLAAPLIIPVSYFKNMTVNSTLFLLRNAMNSGISIYRFRHSCINDMRPNSDFLRQLNSTGRRIPIVNIYGAEDHWQVVRALGSLSSVEEVKNPVHTDVEFDQKFFPAMYSGLGLVNQVQTTHNLVYNALGVAAVFMPWIRVTRELVLKARFNWDEIYRYLETGIHTDLAETMGAVEYRLQNYCMPYSLDLKKLKCRTAFLPVVTENDGVVARTDVHLPSSAGLPVFNVRVKGVNHQEMGNHIAMRRLFDEIINRKSYGAVFAK